VTVKYTIAGYKAYLILVMQWTWSQFAFCFAFCEWIAPLSEMFGQSCDFWRSRLTPWSASVFLYIKGSCTHLFKL